MITISRQTDYATRIILHLSREEPGCRVTSALVAREGRIPPVFVRRIVTRLAAAGLLKTTRGPEGGLTLARPPAQISLLDVVDAIEGPLALNTCVLDDSACPLEPVCPAHPVWIDIRNSLARELSQVTFDRLVANQVITEGRE